MTWMCPACRMTIEHADDTPRADVVYRCHVCRLELVVDTERQQLTLASTRVPPLNVGPTHANDTTSLRGIKKIRTMIGIERRSCTWGTNQNGGTDVQTTNCGHNGTSESASGMHGGVLKAKQIGSR